MHTEDTRKTSTSQADTFTLQSFLRSFIEKIDGKRSQKCQAKASERRINEADANRRTFTEAISCRLLIRPVLPWSIRSKVNKYKCNLREYVADGSKRKCLKKRMRQKINTVTVQAKTTAKTDSRKIYFYNLCGTSVDSSMLTKVIVIKMTMEEVWAYNSICVFRVIYLCLY